MISVIIPTYNAAAYIGEAMDSVFAQTYRDYEIIVIDDGSTDETKELLEQHYPTINYYYVENNGVSAARNLGIAKAQGEFIAFLDADDWWLPEKLEKQLVLFEVDKTLGLVLTENYFFTAVGLCGFTNKKRLLMQGDIVKNIFLNSYAVTSTVMVRKSVFEQVGLFEEELSVAEDDNLWMRIGMNYDIALVDEKLAHYRITNGSLSRNIDAVISGVGRQIEIMKERYPNLYDRLGLSAVKKKYADLYFSEAYRDFSRGNYVRARQRFIDSFIYYHYRPKLLFYLLSTYLPAAVIEQLKRIKRILFKKNYAGAGKHEADMGQFTNNIEQAAPVKIPQ